MGQSPTAYGSSGVDELASGTRMYLPNVCTRDGYYNYAAVQNVGGTTANTTITYYGYDGSSYQQSTAILPHARATYAAQDTPDMPPGDYSAVIESDQPIAVSQSTFGSYLFSGDFVQSKIVAYGSNGVMPVSK
jgi:hypothetical protein